MLCIGSCFPAECLFRDDGISLGHAGNGYQSAYGLQNGAVHLGSGQPTAQQGFAGLSNLQLQQRLALLQESSGVGLPGQGLQASPGTALVAIRCCSPCGLQLSRNPYSRF